MAFVDPQARRRVEVPDEPGQWVELRPLTARDYAEIQRGAFEKSAAEIGLDLLVRSITGWSYARELNAANLDLLDYPTFRWLESQLDITSNRRSDEEKKDSGSPSSVTTAPAMANSPES